MAFQAPAGVTLVDHPLIRVKLTRLRCAATGPAEFRRTLKEIARLLVYEVTRDLPVRTEAVQTPLGPCEGSAFSRPVIVVPILRAGLGLAEGMLEVLEDASVGHIGMARDEKTLRPDTYYSKMPARLSEAEVMVVDPMLATGWSATAAIDRLKAQGAVRLRYVCLLGCPEGLKQIHAAHPEVPVFTTAIDEGLNGRGYIVPGLGDAGDRYFGTVPE